MNISLEELAIGIKPEQKTAGDKDEREFLFAEDLPEVIERCFAETSQSLVQV